MTKRRVREDEELKEIAQTIRAGIMHFRERNERGDYSAVMTWVMPGKLACAARPLRYHHIYGGSGKALPSEAKPELDKWIECVRSEGIVSLICLVSEKELAHYTQLLPVGTNLIDYYRESGFEVCHIPWSDPAHSGYGTFYAEVADKRPVLLRAYDELLKPILVHCSAAIDRTPPVVAYVVLKREEPCRNGGA